MEVETAFIEKIVVPRLIYIKYPGLTFKNGKYIPVAENFDYLSRQEEYANLTVNVHRVSFMLTYEDNTNKPFYIIVKVFPKYKNRSNLVPKYNYVLNEMMMAAIGPAMFGKFFFPTYYVDNIFEFLDHPIMITSNPMKEGFYYVTKRKFSDEEIIDLAAFMAEFHSYNFLLHSHPIFDALCQWVYEHSLESTEGTLNVQNDQNYQKNASVSILMNSGQENFYFRKKKVGNTSDVKVLDWHMVKVGPASDDVLSIIPFCEDLNQFNYFVKIYIQTVCSFLNPSTTMKKEKRSFIERGPLKFDFFDILDLVSGGIVKGLREYLNNKTETSKKENTKVTKKENKKGPSKKKKR